MAHFTADLPSGLGVEDLLGILERSRPAWHADAACHEAPFYISWFNDGDAGELSWLTDEQNADEQAKAVCARCLVVDECRAWAFAEGPMLNGVWGGMNRADRARARRRGALGAPAPMRQAEARPA
ncbi:WhiB family transcriptional regulator [Acidiferrimicrobium sp. IK]|uniref:WhiB family transcriptional regulator n=1 Tax=Acidiferrimicrobium sp. IK TaxID=2871700 RepID=UPI0021CB1AAE|nr:WhiB family transcriptional regulator [Acidiferrimicrobium sp. IK]MCU4183500.1 WhiB family transcriptional regulator [Acidiferrimicrobium sp. IK]